MSYNLRLIGSVVMTNETTNDDSGNDQNAIAPTADDEDKNELIDLVKKKSVS